MPLRYPVYPGGSCSFVRDVDATPQPAAAKERVSGSARLSFQRGTHTELSLRSALDLNPAHYL